MGRIVACFFTTVDGVVESPHEWHFPYFDDAMGRAVDAVVGDAVTYLMGRTLYDEWSQYWPGNTTDGFGQVINPIAKYVVSSTLTGADWENTTVIPGDGAARGVAELKASTDGTIAMSGCATTVRWLLSEGLLDELVLLVDPIAVGSGQRLFEGADSHPADAVVERGVRHRRAAPALRPRGAGRRPGPGPGIMSGCPTTSW